MIKIQIATDGNKVHDQFEVDQPTLKECSLMVYYLEQYIQDLISREFKSEFEVRDGEFAEGEDGGE